MGSPRRPISSVALSTPLGRQSNALVLIVWSARREGNSAHHAINSAHRRIAEETRKPYPVARDGCARTADAGCTRDDSTFGGFPFRASYSARAVSTSTRCASDHATNPRTS